MLVLGASLALNFLGAGFMLGKGIGGPSSPPRDMAGPGFDNPRRLARLAEELPDESRRAFRQAFREEIPDIRAAYREMRAHRRELFAVMSNDDWDKDEVAAKMDEINALRDQQRAAFDRALIGALDAISPEDRALLFSLAEQRRAERRAERREGRRQRFNGGERPPPPPEQ